MARDTPGARLDLPYPCRWTYKIIGDDEDTLRSAAIEIVQAREHTISLSRRSAERNYCCLDIEVLIYDERDRVTIYEALREHPAVRMIL